MRTDRFKIPAGPKKEAVLRHNKGVPKFASRNCLIYHILLILTTRTAIINLKNKIKKNIGSCITYDQ